MKDKLLIILTMAAAAIAAAVLLWIRDKISTRGMSPERRKVKLANLDHESVSVWYKLRGTMFGIAMIVGALREGQVLTRVVLFVSGAGFLIYHWRPRPKHARQSHFENGPIEPE